MGNEWIDFVKRFAREHQMSYTQALKEAAPVYRHMKRMVGGGLDDLPESIKKEIGSALDVRSLARLNTTNRGMREANVRELEDRRLKLELEAKQFPDFMRDFWMSVWAFHETGGNPRGLPADYYDSVQSHLDLSRRLVNNPLLSDVQREKAQKAITELTKIMRNRMVGRGLDDLPEALQKEVGTHLTDQELGRLNVASRGMDRANASALEDRRLQLEAREMDSVIDSSEIPMVEVYRNPQAALDRMDIYYRTFTDVLDSNPFLTEGQRQRLNEELDFLERQYGQIRRQFNL